MSYTANDLQTLKWNESVQKRSGMYLGAVAKDSSTPGQKNVAIREIVDNSTTESVKGKCNKIYITFCKDGCISVLDNGRGIPVDTDENGINGIDKCLATLHSGGNFAISEKSGAGLNGVGASCTNAVSSSFKVEVLKGRFVYTKEYSNGETLGGMSKKKFDSSIHPFKENFKSGTCVTFKLNDEFFEPQDLVHPEDIIERMRYTAYILPGLEINIQDDSRKKEDGGGVYYFKNQEGIKELVEFISDKTPSLIQGKSNWEKKGIFSFEGNISYNNKGRRDKAFVDVAFQYTQSDKTDIRSFANTVQTFNGGIHEEAIKNAFYKVFKQKDTIEEDVTTGLLAVVSVNLPEPQFSSQAKVKLTGKNAGDAIEKLIIREVRKWNNSLSPEEQKIIEKHVKNNAKIRKAAEVAKVAKKKSLNKTNNFNLPSNLKDCSKIGGVNSELYICEGLSAAGTILAARDSKYQGVLPIRGKCLNVWGMDLGKKNQLERFQKNAEISDMIKAIGAGMMNNFNIEKTRYERVCFACFTGDTKVKSLDGKSYSFKELIEENINELWVYSRDENGNVVPAKATNIRKTGETDKLVELTFDNGKSVKCTIDHNFMTSTGDYIQAKDIVEGQSLMALHTKINEAGYEEFYDINSESWMKAYSMVAENIHQEEKLDAQSRLQDEKHFKHQFGAHEHTHFGKNGYNDSGLQRKNLRKAHKENVAKTNIGKSIAFLIQNDYEIDKYHYNFYKVKNACRFDKITDYFDSLDDAIKFACKRKWNFDKYKISSEYVTTDESKLLGLKAKIAKTILKLEKQNLPFNKENYEKNRVFNSPKYDSIAQCFKTFDSAVECAHNLNHKVTKVKIVNVEQENVYCMTVDKYHNFLLDSGVFVKNCDSDSDGFAISTLLTGIFYKLFKPMLEQGRVYLVCSPLFTIDTKKKTYYALNDIEKNKIVKELESKKEKYELSRAKGLGELQKEVFSEIVLNPENRKLRQLTVEDGEKATKWLDLCLANGEYKFNGEVGYASDARKLWMTDHSSIVEELDFE